MSSIPHNEEIFWNFWQPPEVTEHYKKIPPLYMYVSQRKTDEQGWEFKGQ